MRNSISKNDKKIVVWLLIGCLLVASMLILGSITRLTNSGLSMVTWKPITGVVPPLNEASWQAEFLKYKTSPEYKKLNYHFSLSDFKEIFFWEYSHRLLGRIAGVVFLIPFLYFLITKKIKSKKLIYHLLVIFFLGGMQGVIGWFMVKSGLRDNPHVSHYWLAFHLVTALFLIAYIYLVMLSLLYPNKNLPNKKTKKVYFWTKILLFFTIIQIIYGAFIAGLKAGKFYPTFPKMGTEWLPNVIDEAFQEQGFIALVSDAYTIQFIHRWLAVIVLILVFYIVMHVKRGFYTIIQKKALFFLGITISIQFLLGVFTILYSVPIVLGVLHQFGAMLFLIAILNILYFFKTVNLKEESIA